MIGAPLDLGAGRRGVDMGPSAFRVAGIDQRIRDLGHEVTDAGDLKVSIPETQVPGDPRMKYLAEIREVCEVLRDKVEQVLEGGGVPVALGGDHSIAIGTIAGVSRHFSRRGEKIGLIWFDAHGDANTAETSPSGNIHGMPLAVALGLGESTLVELGGPKPMVEGARAAVVGLRDVDERGMRAVMEEAIKRASTGTAGIHVSFDMDGIDPEHAPGVGTPVAGGLSYREAHLAMEMLADTGAVLSAELVEVNPILDQRNGTAALAVELLASLLGKKIL